MGRRFLLISFDMSNEVFKEVLLLPPPTEGCNCIDQDIPIINDSLTLILKFPHDWKHTFEIWVLNECGERNWTKTLTIIRQIPVFRNLLQLREDGSVVLTTDDKDFVLYDPIKKKRDVSSNKWGWIRSTCKLHRVPSSPKWIGE
jgi:hypothetical protein